MAVFGYGRVSTTQQTTDNQLLELKQAGYQVDYWFADTGVSGKVSATQRKQFAELLHKIRDGETLVVAKIDRLGRDAVDVLQTIKLLEHRSIKVIICQFGNLDVTSSTGGINNQVQHPTGKVPRWASTTNNSRLKNERRS
ncbi:recombinase family protein [Hydrogenophaga bisanensis]|uniref:Recombinase family protein n=1 Tax=Hydrogenophaga bisanensis TaxID=439611 RepID=A0ABW2REZ3_9BURK